MSMNELLNIFKSVFDFLWSIRLFNMPFMFWLIGLVIFGAVLSFIKGGKKNEK